MIDSITYASICLGVFLFFLFLGLKIFGLIDWSWWWVVAPLLAPAALIFGPILLIVTAAALFPGPNL